MQRRKPLQRHRPLAPGKKGLGKNRSGKTRPNTLQAPNEIVETTDDTKAAAVHKLWAILRDKEIRGLTFRNRELVGPYLADFICPAAKMVLVLTGGSDASEQIEWLQLNGYRVLAFPADDVLSNPQMVLDGITATFALRVISRND